VRTRREIADQDYYRLGYQHRQLGDDIQRLKDDVRCPIAVGRFELEENPIYASLCSKAAATRGLCMPKQ
jgi:hypothetical protein